MLNPDDGFIRPGISDFSLEADPVEFFDDLTSTALPQYS